MILSETEIDEIVKEASASTASGVEIRRVLQTLPDFEFGRTGTTPLAKLCAAGADYGWRELEAVHAPDFVATLPAPARRNLRRHLRRNLEQITRPCLNLEWRSFRLAMSSIGLAAAQPQAEAIKQMFLRDKPSDRLFLLFKKFPVLAGLWCELISQWREQVSEVLSRFATDRPALARTFCTSPIRNIVNVHLGLSDRHNAGRTVVRLGLEAGSLIYKPRSGMGEAEWFSLLTRMNKNGYHPELQPARVLRRKGYCWMEEVDAAPCKSKAAIRRFYQRLGGIIAAAYLLKAVDCHRENLIASGEDPVLVDMEALWHISPPIRRHTFSDILYQTGFFPNRNPRSLQSRSSVLGPGTTGKHVPRFAGKPVKPDQYRRELALGFARAWRAILGTHKTRAAFTRQLRRIQSTERRWFYWATETYAAIREASIQPQALRSVRERETLLRLRCKRDNVAPEVIEAEVRALAQLDIPYFARRTNETLPPDLTPVPGELITALCAALPDSH